MGRRIAVTFVLGLVAVLTVAVSADGQEQAVATALTIEVEPPLRDDVGYRLAATLTTRQATPVPGARVSVYRVVDLLGEREALLGTAVTDATGKARVPITPRRADLRIAATYAGDDEHAATTTEHPVTFPDDAVEPYAHVHGHSQLLQPVRTVMPRAITVAVGLLWLGLLGLLVATIRGIRTAPDAPPHDQLLKEGTTP